MVAKRIGLRVHADAMGIAALYPSDALSNILRVVAENRDLILSS
jgi:hypothetical protein